MYGWRAEAGDSYLYVQDVVGPWPAGEAAIATNGKYSKLYEKYRTYIKR